ncbi:MAG TPA: hypothetical protein VGM91_18440 [Conexibacter sp.]
MTELTAGQVERLLPRAEGAIVVVGEVPAAQGIADIVAVRFNAEAVQRRADVGVGPMTSPLRMRCLNVLRRDRPMRTETLARKMGTNARALNRSTLQPLAEMGVIELSGELVRATGAWEPVGTHLTAVELKLSKWRSALRQADNFAMSADRSWVVLDEARGAGALAALDHFQDYGVGLALLSTDGRLKVKLRPRGRRPQPWLRALMAECAWSAAEEDVVALARIGDVQATSAQVSRNLASARSRSILGSPSR